MRLVGQLVNLAGPLGVVLGAHHVGDFGGLKRRSTVAGPEPRRLGNGVVQRAVVKVLSDASRPMRAPEVHEAVEGLLGHTVSRGSVSWCLAAGARGEAQRFVRVARERYRLGGV
jgi:hypothetical protein